MKIKWPWLKKDELKFPAYEPDQLAQTLFGPKDPQTHQITPVVYAPGKKVTPTSGVISSPVAPVATMPNILAPLSPPERPAPQVPPTVASPQSSVQQAQSVSPWNPSTAAKIDKTLSPLAATMPPASATGITEVIPGPANAWKPEITPMPGIEAGQGKNSV